MMLGSLRPDQRSQLCPYSLGLADDITALAEQPDTPGVALLRQAPLTSSPLPSSTGY